MRAIIKRILVRLIYPVYKRFVFATGGFYLSRVQSDMEDVLARLVTLGFNPKTVIDVGVADGTEDLYRAFTGSHMVLIEPLKEFEPYMQSMTNKYDLEYIVAAASDLTGSLDINVHPDLCGSSIMDEIEGKSVDGEARTVPTIRIDSFISEKNLKPPYLIKIDVQGAELKVLDGVTGILDQTEVIILEVSLFGFFINGPQFSDVVSYMGERGFSVYDIFNGRNRPFDGALAQVDVVFVKEEGVFRQDHVYAKESQRVVQNEKLRREMPGV